MKNERIHPHEVMADLVNEYEKNIKPAIENGNMNYLKGMKVNLSIADDIMFYNAMLVNPKDIIGIFMRIQSDIASLSDIEPKGKLLETLSASLERNIADINLMLNNDPHYKRFRRNN